MLRVAVPNKGRYRNRRSRCSRGRLPATERPQGPHRHRPGERCRILLPASQDIAIYVGSGQLDFGITGRDLAAESGAPVSERLALGFGSSSFRYAAPAGRSWTVADLAGKRIATAYPHLVRRDLAARGIDATVIRLDGAVEISVQLGVADAIADVVGSGRTLSLHDLVAFGEPLCDSEAVLIERANAGDTNRAARDQLAARVQGVVFGQQYLMLDYDCPARCSTAPPRSPRSGIAHHRPAGRPGLGRSAGSGTAAGGQCHHGPARRYRGQGDSGLRRPLLPVLKPP